MEADGQGLNDADHNFELADTVNEGPSRSRKGVVGAKKTRIGAALQKRARKLLVPSVPPFRSEQDDMQNLVANSLRQALPGFLNDIAQGIKEELAPIIKEHGAKIEAQGRSIDQLQEVVGRHDVRLDTLEKTLMTIKEEGVSTAVGSPSRVSSVTSPPSSAAYFGNHWRPNYIEIKGFCSFEERVEKGIDRTRATTFVKNLKDQLLEELKGKVGDIHLKGQLNCSIRAQVDPGFAMEIQGTLRD
eukprot:15662851-Heterocapsa_arctica.AAC.1